MSWTTESTQIMTGNEVVGSDGEKVGTVAEVQPGYIVIEKGFFFPTDYYIPMSAIASVANGQVYLNVAKDAALHSGWDTVPDAVPAAMTGTETIITDVDHPGVAPGPETGEPVGQVDPHIAHAKPLGRALLEPQLVQARARPHQHRERLRGDLHIGQQGIDSHNVVEGAG